MSRSLSLRTLRALRRGSPILKPHDPYSERPKGALIWIHVPDWHDIANVVGLIRRLLSDSSFLSGGTPSVLLTGPVEDLPDLNEPRVIVRPVPHDTRQDVLGFLSGWSPDLLIWTHGVLHPILISEADNHNIPRVFLAARGEYLRLSSARWLPGILSNLLDGFHHTLTEDTSTRLRLRRMGLDPTRIEALGPLGIDTIPPPFNEAEHSDMAAAIGTRSVWLALDVPANETRSIAQAHLAASRRAPRLLLVLVPADPDTGPDLADSLRADGFNVGLRSDGDDPNDGTQIYIADFAEESGMWLRLAPITYFGGTLTSGISADPMGAAELGSAVLHGPRLLAHGPCFRLLAEKGAARLIRDALDLGEAVETLLAPDRAADMALAGWKAASDGATITNRVIDLVQSILDEKET